MIRLRQISTVLMMLAACLIAGCTPTTGDRTQIKYTNLPSREVQAVYPADFKVVHDTCLRVVRDQLGYTVSDEDCDTTVGRGRIEGASEPVGSVRIECERSRDLTSTTIKAFAVEAGATEANSEKARAILDAVERAIWSGKP